MSDEEISKKRAKLLRDPVVSAAFTHYCNQNWQVKELLDQLRKTGVDLRHLREWATWSFHPLGRDEADKKRERGLKVQRQLKKALVGYENAIDCYRLYASAPDFGRLDSKHASDQFQRLVQMNQCLAHEARQMLQRTKTGGLYKPKRLGVNWNTSYLYLSKVYIAKFTGWNERKVLDVVTHMITAAKRSLRNRVPKNLRSLLRKAIRNFENDPNNATLISRLQLTVADPDVLTKQFPPLTSHPD